MALRGKKPEEVQKRLKAMFFGVAGAGKTTAAIQFPKPYLIDTEKGAENDQYVKALAASGGMVYQTSDFEEMVKEVTTLLSEKHDYQTLIIDPITVLYSNLLEKAAAEIKRTAKEKDATGTEFGRHYGVADGRMKHLVNLLLRLDMNVIVTCHAKTVYGDNLVKLGNTFDGYKKLDYLFDLVFELDRRGKQRVGIVKKTRHAGFVDGEVFEFSYDAVAEKYGRAVLERSAVAEVLATAEQVAELTRLVDVLKVPGDTVEKWLEKAQANSFGEMPTATAAKCIVWCQDQVNKKGTGQ